MKVIYYHPVMKYTKELLKPIVENSRSYSEVCRKLGTLPKGAMWQHIKNKVLQHGLDTSHFGGKDLGRRLGGGHNRHSYEQILVEGKTDRERPYRLRRALIESGLPYQCESCGNNGKWNGKDLILEVDHKDGDWSNCKKENLRFMCPNCHSQTPTYSKKIK